MQHAPNPTLPPAPPVAVATRFVVEDLSKVFAGTTALNAVSLAVRAGEIHGLIGGNGSGKSTLIKIAAGVYQGEPGGVVEINGIRTDAASMTSTVSHTAGLRVVHQDLGVFQDMTVGENLALGAGFVTGRGGRIRQRAGAARASELMDRFEIPGSPRALMRELSRAAQTQVAIARAMQDVDPEAPGVLILDEPTTALAEHEVEGLMNALRRYAAQGHAIIYVSHRIRELLAVTDRLTVLRDGRVADVLTTKDVGSRDVIRAIVGSDVAAAAARTPVAEHREVAVRVRGLAAYPLLDASFDIHRGEILGVAGLVGSGRSTLLRTLFGETRAESGTIELDGEVVRHRHPADAIAAGIAYVPEDRGAEGAFLDESVAVNVAAGRWGRYWRGLLMRPGRMRADAAEAMDDFFIRASSERALLSTMSGGNQQKAVLARWMRRDPRLLLLDEPTQGVDIGARSEIYDLVRAAADRGPAVVVVASDLEELALVSDRVIVIRDGRVCAEATGDDLTADALTRLTHGEGQD